MKEKLTFERKNKMKKIISILISMFLLFSFVDANETEEYNLENVSRLHFEPVGGGKFIYCNNPEPLGDDMILNGDAQRYIMNNENLKPDDYYIYISHFNYTKGDRNGYDIELDMEMKAKDNSVITIHKAYFETPENYGFYDNGKKYVKETDWGHLQVCADMLGVSMCDIRGDDFYYPRSYESITVEVNAGEKIWLSDYLESYEPVKIGKGVHIQAFVTIESGTMDFNVAAFKSDEENDPRENIPQKVNFGEYRWDYTLKGIADSLPEVETEIDYTIEENTESGTKIPVFLKNQYIPEGHVVTEWYTQLNPQNDIWSKINAAESDILPLIYKDQSKSDFYGVNVVDKDNTFVFDTVHSALKKFENKFDIGKKEDFVPNFLLTTEKDNHEYACNIGNYGVSTTYKMNIKNNTNSTKYCSLVITAASEIIAYKTDEKGNKSNACVKDLTGEKVSDNMLSQEIPPNTSQEFKFSIILPVNYNGGIKNELVITDENIQTVDFENKKKELEDKHLKSGYSLTSELTGRYLDEIFPITPDETKELFENNENSFEYLRGNNLGLIRFCAWDGAPEWYFNHWGEFSNTVYTVNESFEKVNEYTFSSLPIRASYADEMFYVETARDGIYKSSDGLNWEKTYNMPEYIPYYDLENASEWAKEELIRGWNENLRLKWYGESYNFKSGISREEFCELAVKLLDKLNAAESNEIMTEFSDTTNESVLRLANCGIIKGMGDGTFRSKDELTREMAAAILIRLCDYLDINTDFEDICEFADYDSIADWAKSDVAKINALGIMHGVGDNLFEPQGTYSVEQSALTVLRTYECIKLIRNS